MANTDVCKENLKNRKSTFSLSCFVKHTFAVLQELDEAAQAQLQPAEVRRLPKGTSAYQAAWILDGSNGSDDDGDAEELEDVVVRQPAFVMHTSVCLCRRVSSHICYT